MWFLGLALAGGLQADLEKAATSWIEGKPSPRFSVLEDEKRRLLVKETGAVRLQLAGVGLSYLDRSRPFVLRTTAVVNDPKHPKLMYLTVDSRLTPPDRFQPMEMWEKQEPQVASLALEVYGAIKKDCLNLGYTPGEEVPLTFRQSDKIKAELERSLKNLKEMCEAPQLWPERPGEFMLNDLGFWAFNQENEMIGYLRGEWRWDGDKVVVALSHLKLFEELAGEAKSKR